MRLRVSRSGSAARTDAPGPRFTQDRAEHGGASMKQIVVAVDGSEGARVALEAGIEIAKPFGALLTAVYVRHPQHSYVGEPYAQRALSGDLKKARGALEDAESVAQQAGVTVEAEEIEGDAADAILDFARDRHADLIVVGSRGLGTVAGTLLGSVSSKIVHQADRPVLVARRPG
jgi:nucleotide-binding universal stress UspA family protein